jgi:hypothetical protein
VSGPNTRNLTFAVGGLLSNPRYGPSRDTGYTADKGGTTSAGNTWSNTTDDGRTQVQLHSKKNLGSTTKPHGLSTRIVPFQEPAITKARHE